VIRGARSLLAPRWLAWHATLVLVLVAFVLLGRWQLDSFSDENRADEAASEQAPADVATVLEPGDRLTTAVVGRTVTATGRYDAGNQLLVAGRRLDGRDGYLVVTPLRTAAGILPVNRGWVPSAEDPATDVPAGDVTVTGVVQPSETDRDSRVDLLADLPADQIPYLATVQLLDALRYTPDELYDGYVVLRAQKPESAGPLPVEPRDEGDGVGKWRNLGYALQWWLFAGAAIVFWWVVLRRSLRDEQPGREAQPVDPAGV